MKPQWFFFSEHQEDGGGLQACTTVATMWATSLADGPIVDGTRYFDDPSVPLTMLRWGVRMWLRHGKNEPRSFHQVWKSTIGLGSETQSAYQYDSWALTTKTKPGNGRVPFRELATIVRDLGEHKGPIGAVLTTSGSSYTFGGQQQDGWYFLDSHAPEARMARYDTFQSLFDQTLWCLVGTERDVDVSFVWRP